MSDSLSVPTHWVSGYYEARILLTGGDEAGRAYRLWFLVREPAPNASAILVQAPTNTWQAYNNWGGRNLYDFNSAVAAPATPVSRPVPWRQPKPQAERIALGRAPDSTAQESR